MSGIERRADGWTTLTLYSLVVALYRIGFSIKQHYALPEDCVCAYGIVLRGKKNSDYVSTQHWLSDKNEVDHTK